MLRLPVSPTGRGRLRSHQRSSELVATLDAASDKEAVFLYIVVFFEDRVALRFSFVGMAGALFVYSFIT